MLDSGPDPPPIANANPQPLAIDESELARQRQQLNRRRSGRRSLRVDTGTANTANTGLSIPIA